MRPELVIEGRLGLSRGPGCYRGGHPFPSRRLITPCAKAQELINQLPCPGAFTAVKGNAPSTSSHINCERVGETDGRCLAGPVSVCVSALENAMILK